MYAEEFGKAHGWCVFHVFIIPTSQSNRGLAKVIEGEANSLCVMRPPSGAVIVL